MRPLTLDIQNFGSIKKLSLSLANQGMVLILGENRDEPKADSNGAGKSLLLDAFCWCLWGETIRGLSGDEVVNEFEGKDCKVVVTFEDEGKTYKVTRTRLMTGKGQKPNDLLFEVDGVDASKESMKATQKVIVEALGVDFGTFRAMMPGADLKAANMTDKEVKNLIEDLLQSQVLSVAQELAREEVKRLKADLVSVQQEQANLRKLINGSIARLTEYETKHASFEEDKDAKILKIQAQVATQMDIIDKAMKVAKQWKKESAKLEELRQKHKDLSSQLKELRAESLALQSKALKEESKLRGEEAMEQLVLFGTERELTKLRALGPSCKECGQAIDPVFKCTHESEKLAVISQQKAKLEEIQSQKNVTAAYWQEKSEETAQKVRNVEDTVRHVTNAIQVLEQQETKFKIAEVEYSTAKKRIKELSDEQTKVQEQTSPFADLIESERQNRQQWKAGEEELVKRESALAEELKLYEFWVEGFSTAGLRSYMLEHVTPILNAKAQHYANILTDGTMTVQFDTKTELANGEQREKFNIKVDQAHGSSNYLGNSKGERAKADLVICMALGDLASLRANKMVPFRFLDEPFESVDSSGTDAIVKLLHDQRERYETVFVITHNDHFKQLFDKRITVVKKDNVSYLEEEHVGDGQGDSVGA